MEKGSVSLQISMREIYGITLTSTVQKHPHQLEIDKRMFLKGCDSILFFGMQGAFEQR